MDPTFPELDHYDRRNRDTDLVGARLATQRAEQRSVAVMATLAACAIAGAAIWAAGARAPSAGLGGVELEAPFRPGETVKPRS